VKTLSRGGAHRKPERSRGQILIMFVMAIFVFTGMVALVIDISWYWVNSLRVQRAADAAALAGVVQLPTNPTGANGAYALARAEAVKNGYDDASAAISVTPQQEPPTTGRRLVVTVSAPVDMFFMRIFGISQITATRTAKAEFVLPVPMGSPENYYGVFGDVRGLTSTTTTTIPGHTDTGSDNSGFQVPDQAPTTSPSSKGFTPSSGSSLVNSIITNNNNYVQTPTNGNYQDFWDFDLLAGLGPDDTATQVTGLEVRLSDAYLLNGSCTNSYFQVALSYDAGLHWTTDGANNRAPATTSLTTNNATDYTLGAANSVSAWPLASPAHTWAGADLGNSNFRVRVTAAKGCTTSNRTLRIDQLEVRATFNVDTWVPPQTTTVTTNLGDVPLQGPGTACGNGIANCYVPDGQALNPRGFWGTMNTQGADSINGDAYQPYWDTGTSTTNPAYDAINYYNYAVEMPAGSTGGAVYVFDPVFCTTANNRGTGDRWFSDAGDQVSSFYELYDTNNTLYDVGDDGAAIASSSGLFRGISASDSTMGGGTSGDDECLHKTDSAYGDGRDYHNQWYLLASGLSGGANGRVYRLHTTSTDPANVTAQRTTDGENSFALYASAGGGTPRIYGIGAMQAFTPLSASGSTVTSEFYLAQIDAVHAGKTVEIKLWDPGDTRPLTASLKILVPTSSGWASTLLDYTAAQGTTNGGAATCDSAAGNNVGSIQTNVGNTNGTFNGCWLTIQIPIPGDYQAYQDGWWKIQYIMSGSGTSNDVTTWKVEIRGNPVHLIIP
jgi:Flp pilus assembly protein TadG